MKVHIVTIQGALYCLYNSIGASREIDNELYERYVKIYNEWEDIQKKIGKIYYDEK